MDNRELKEYIEMRKRTVKSLTETAIKHDMRDNKGEANNCIFKIRYYEFMIGLAEGLLSEDSD